MRGMDFNLKHLHNRSNMFTHLKYISTDHEADAFSDVGRKVYQCRSIAWEPR